MKSSKGVEVYIYTFLTPALDDVRDQLHTLAALPSGKKLPVANGRWDPESVGTLCRRKKCLAADRN
jgi:hypothetical protein